MRSLNGLSEEVHVETVDHESALRRWWREESWIEVSEEPQLTPQPLHTALALGETIRKLGVGLHPDRDYSGHLRAIMQADGWQESRAESLHALASGALASHTPYAAIMEALEQVSQRSADPFLRARACRNLGAAALDLGNLDRVLAAGQEAMALLAGQHAARRPAVEAAVYLQRSRVALQEGRPSQALHHGLHANTLARYHEGGRQFVESIQAHVAFCAALDGRVEMAWSWLGMLEQPTVEGGFARDVVKAWLLLAAGRKGAARDLARASLALWPRRVARRKHARLAGMLVGILEECGCTEPEHLPTQL